MNKLLATGIGIIFIVCDVFVSTLSAPETVMRCHSERMEGNQHINESQKYESVAIGTTIRQMTVARRVMMLRSSGIGI
jgi:hypothetical protein